MEMKPKSKSINRWSFKVLLASLMLFICGFSSQINALTLKRGEALRALPVQSDGRTKPFDSFAREMLELIYGKQKYEGREAYEIIFTWMLAPQVWTQKELFEVRNHEVLKNLN
ncbi:MAG: hypothetical protein L6Q37_16000, partial [Bdellovibrionaceae bacterium]|nr:hypothetical protein [Pseudobdellovibrionaceae bacterium]